MKNIIRLIILTVFVFIISLPLTSDAYVSVRGYYKKNGTYVAPHVRSDPNGLKYDNYSYKPSQGLYNTTYGTRGSTWNTPTYVTDPYYYVGQSIYKTGLTNTYTSTYIPTYTPTKTGSYYTATYTPSVYENFNTVTEKVYTEPVVVPANARKFGDTWYCNGGYKTLYDSSLKKTGCEKIIAPANSHIVDENWQCDVGYENLFDKNVNRIGCKKIIIPENATSFGDSWMCKVGYVTIYDKFNTKIGCKSKEN